MTAKQANSSGNDAATYSSSTELYLSEFKEAAMQDPGLAVSNFKQVSPREVSFQLCSRAVAVGVALETPLAGRFSNNGLLVRPWAPLSLSFHAASEIAGSELEKSLSLMSVYAPPSAAAEAANV